MNKMRKSEGNIDLIYEMFLPRLGDIVLFTVVFVSVSFSLHMKSCSVLFVKCDKCCI